VSARIVPCPTCQKPVEWSERSDWRPFCSERCKLIDLGAWVMEEHRIPGEEADLGADIPDGDTDDTRTH
jgi:endogenous inhibitor of DNA gyrase (YacG/DUF329 family)